MFYVIGVVLVVIWSQASWGCADHPRARKVNVRFSAAIKRGGAADD
jgi:hypothetical protein